MKYLSLPLIIILLLLSYNSASAQSFPYPVVRAASPPALEDIKTTTAFFGCTSEDTIGQCAKKIAATVLNVITFVAVAMAAIMFIWAGILYMTQKDEKRAEIRKRILYAAVGLVIALGSFAIVAILRKTVETGT